MKETNPYKQIDLGLKYINSHKLYKGDVCKALDRHKRVGHYLMRAKDPRDQRRYKARRLQVLNASGWVCYYCGGEASQVDHVIPIASGGDPMSLDNLSP